jgi:hypothetical protein
MAKGWNSWVPGDAEGNAKMLGISQPSKRKEGAFSVEPVCRPPECTS